MSPLRGGPAWSAVTTLTGLGVALLGPEVLRLPAVLLVAVPLILIIRHLLRHPPL